MSFHFLDPGPLFDGELELVTPHKRWIDDYLVGADASQGGVTRTQIEDFVRVAPKGRYAPDPGSGRAPTYHFWMRLHPPVAGRPLPHWAQGQIGRIPPLQIAGSIGLRIGHTVDIEMYLGNIGYNVQPFARGNHYAERACRLLRPLALAHGLRPLWITCNPDNIPSRRTCERLGCVLVGQVPLPPDHSLRSRGDKEKLRFRWDI